MNVPGGQNTSIYMSGAGTSSPLPVSGKAGAMTVATVEGSGTLEGRVLPGGTWAACSASTALTSTCTQYNILGLSEVRLVATGECRANICA